MLLGLNGGTYRPLSTLATLPACLEPTSPESNRDPGCRRQTPASASGVRRRRGRREFDVTLSKCRDTPAGGVLWGKA